jgi:hypothetical protein
MFALKGWLFVVISLIFTATVYSQDVSIVKTPLVSGATDVPVLGGSLEVFGLNFGDDPSVIKVFIHNNDNSVFQCTDVQIVKPNTAISCTVTDIGTGSAKHIEVVVGGVPNSDDTNLAFKRSAPLVNKLTYSEGVVVRLYGHDFGFNADLVVVKLDGVDHSVLNVNDSVITCKKHGSYYVYEDEMTVYVEVDNQTTTASLEALFESEKLHDIEQDISQQPEEQRNRYKTIVLVFIPVVAAIALLAGFLVVKRRRTMLAARASDISTVEQATKSDNSAIMVAAPGPLVRDSSMEEIDLNATNTTTISQTSQPRDRDDDNDAIYELQRSDSSSSFSSLSSTYSSTNCTPCYTPDAPSSPKLDASDFSHSSDTDNSNSNESNDNGESNTGNSKKRNKRSERRERFMNKMSGLAEPISRLGKRSMDSPYFTKQTAFDSPLNTSQEMTPNITTPSRSNAKQRISQGGFDSPLRSSQEMTPKTPTPSSSVEHNSLHNSQEINQLHSSPFDSACVLHSAIQRAAILRAQQKQQSKQQSKQQAAPPSMILQGRRASLGAGHPKNATGRRSSLGTSSLHVTALHNSTGIMKLSERQQQPKQHRSLRKTQYIHQIDEELVEGDE